MTWTVLLMCAALLVAITFGLERSGHAHQGVHDSDRPTVEATRLSSDDGGPELGRLQLTVLSADTGRPTPAMVRLLRSGEKTPYRPPNALDFTSQLDGMGPGWVDPGRNANLPGRLGGLYWCVPGPFTAALPPGDWELTIRRGLEHVPVFDSFTVQAGETHERQYQPRRWVDMRKRGWYSGDGHVHCQVLDDGDAAQLMQLVRAEDVHVVNVLEMGDHDQTWFRQRGFGKDHRLIDEDYVIVPGQEEPRTEEIGHLLAWDLREIIRDPDRYYLYDWICDAVHEQGGLTGYAHVTVNLFNVHRGMSLDVPRDKIDFIELLQYRTMGTELYYDFLNLGFKLTATAGSDMPWGRTPGEVRVYAHIGDAAFGADAWLDGVRRGNTFVTNGPMLDFHVDDAMPGDGVSLNESRPLRVRARAWGDPDRVTPTHLEIVCQGDVIRSVEASHDTPTELSLEFDVEGGHGFWIAARARGSDGSVAHTTPVYVVREGLRFWKYEAVGDLIAKRIEHLGEVEELVSESRRRVESGDTPDHDLAVRRLAEQGEELLRRVRAARRIYDALLAEAGREGELRRDR